MPKKIITIFGSSRAKPQDPEYKNAYLLGRALANAGYEICNGGYAGIMEASARGAKEVGGRTIGVTTRQLPAAKANRYIDSHKRTGKWRDRLFKLIDLASGYVVFSGGVGTLVELSIVWEMTRRRIIPRRPIVILGSGWRNVMQSMPRPETGRSRNIFFAKEPADAVRILKRILK